jgi:GT2 family glycosyltransferase
MKDPISIIIPTYNRVNVLKTVIGSYLVQNKVREILIVDDASTDGTAEFIQNIQKTCPKVVYIRNEMNLGLPATRNVGVRNSSGDFILFGEDDLRFSPDYAEELLKCLKRNGCSIIGGRILFPFQDETDSEAIERTSIDKTIRLDPHRLIYDASSAAPDDINVPFIHACSLIRRDVFDNVQFDEGFRGNAFREETDFYLKARKYGHNIYYCPHTLCIHAPRQAYDLGGTRAIGIWNYKFWSVRNNYRFLKNHYYFLKKDGLVQYGIGTLMIFFAISELQGIVTFYLRRYTPGLYLALIKKFEN